MLRFFTCSVFLINVFRFFTWGVGQPDNRVAGLRHSVRSKMRRNRLEESSPCPQTPPWKEDHSNWSEIKLGYQDVKDGENYWIQKALWHCCYVSRSVSESEEELCEQRMWRDEINLNNRDSLLGNKHSITKIKIKLNKDKEVEIDED